MLPNVESDTACLATGTNRGTMCWHLSLILALLYSFGGNYVYQVRHGERAIIQVGRLEAYLDSSITRPRD